mmetsp:Transcript_150819/g.263599  ORF Transcript_150819/g.263599 Transcript_150819/m.263599 type:complete len:248 (+) Transcript_150819:1549-2292(+)
MVSMVKDVPYIVLRSVIFCLALLNSGVFGANPSRSPSPWTSLDLTPPRSTPAVKSAVNESTREKLARLAWTLLICGPTLALSSWACIGSKDFSVMPLKSKSTPVSCTTSRALVFPEHSSKAFGVLMVTESNTSGCASDVSTITKRWSHTWSPAKATVFPTVNQTTWARKKMDIRHVEHFMPTADLLLGPHRTIKRMPMRPGSIHSSGRMLKRLMPRAACSNRCVTSDLGTSPAVIRSPSVCREPLAV